MTYKQANNYIVKKVYVDPMSSVDVMYLKNFESLKLIKGQLTPIRTPLVGFGGHVVHPEGMITLMMTVRRHPRCRTVPVNFVVVKADFPYNMLMNRPTLNALRAINFMYYLSFKFFTLTGIAEVGNDVCAARECYLPTLQTASASTSGQSSERRSNILSIDCIDPRQTEKSKRLEIGDEVEDILLDLRRQMVDLLRGYRDVFAWAADEVQGVPHHLMMHELNVDLQAHPVKQKKRHFNP
ncbi:uncharacterized protein [Coffea arabica]|uniref:Uncharacterized protein n=1 Tax=Coffea arabica TaxID=13443 RepID=A0ABM4UKG9_COFAR